ncbi:hypothetical protein TNIN_294491 [Trichonephila inaurata madagascariensis]|uniref:Uncharacterized protein n=1 Tax=Trichonephila inaurata madagascariensis TaxID=2747483 RepID=A0A8X7BXY6_9ARAC|nr:hypothetical protein TNIN_294491 [Trichonephila inaurata madagascariensis]
MSYAPTVHCLSPDVPINTLYLHYEQSIPQQEGERGSRESAREGKKTRDGYKASRFQTPPQEKVTQGLTGEGKSQRKKGLGNNNKLHHATLPSSDNPPAAPRTCWGRGRG